MDIDFSKYNEQELKEAWTSIDDYRFPDRAIQIYRLLIERGYSAHEESEYDDSILSNILFMLKPFLGGFLQDMVEENDRCREKEQRVLALIESAKHGTT